MLLTIPYNFTPREYQKNLYNAISTNKYKRAFCIWHRRAGKDKTLINLMIRKAMDRVGTYVYILPTYVMARNIIWRGMDARGIRFLSHIPDQIIKRKSDQEMEIELTNGSIIKMMGSEDPDRLRGINPIGVIFSEYAFVKPNVWDIIRPILVENGGWAVFNTTPNGKNHGYDLFMSVRDNEEWYAELLTVEQTKAITQEDIEKERQAGMSEEMIQQEFYCSFEIGAVGSIWGTDLAQIKKKGHIGFVPYNPNLPIEMFWDLGRKDATAIWLRQTDRGKLNYIYYYEASGTTVESDAKNIREAGFNKIDRIILPHDAKQERKESLTSIEQQVRNIFPNSEVTVLPADNVIAGIRKARSILGRCFFDEVNCSEGIRRLENYKKKYNRSKQAYEDSPFHDENSHGADAFRYSAVSYVEDLPEKDKEIYDEYRGIRRSMYQENNFNDLTPF